MLKGGKLVLIYNSSSTCASFMNKLAQRFGVFFSDGYLYDTSENYGIYSNVF